MSGKCCGGSSQLAHARLAALVASFSEGFETKRLREAREMLAALAE